MSEMRFEDFATRVKPKMASNVLLWGILGFFVAFIVWAAVTELDRTIHAQGRVVPSSRLQVISNLEGGIVEEILVRAGDLVKRGQTLIRLSPTQSDADLGSGEASVASLRVKIARLEAELGGREPRYGAPRNAAEREQISIERALHIARLADLNGLLGASRARLTQAQRSVAEAQAAYQARVTRRDSAQRELELIRPLVEQGIEPRLSLVQLESQASSAASEAAQASAGIARAQGAVAEATAALSQARQDWRAQAATELAAAQAEMSARRQTLPALADRVNRTTVVAPVGGQINRVLVATLGGITGPGAPLIEIVPGEDTLMIEALVMPKDIAFVRIEQPARVNISAYDSAIYGSMEGNVVTISPDATIDERTGESHYTVKVRANAETLRDRTGRKLPIGPGMTADVNLLGDKRSVLDYILSPVTKLSEQAFRE